MPYIRRTVFNPEGEPEQFTDRDNFNEREGARMQDYAFRGAMASREEAARAADREAQLAMTGRYSDRAAQERTMGGTFDQRSSASERMGGTFDQRAAGARELAGLEQGGMTERARMQFGAGQSEADLRRRMYEDQRTDGAGSRQTDEMLDSMLRSVLAGQGGTMGAGPTEQTAPRAPAADRPFDALVGASPTIGAPTGAGGGGGKTPMDMNMLRVIAAMRGKGAVPDFAREEMQRDAGQLALENAKADRARSEADYKRRLGLEDEDRAQTKASLLAAAGQWEAARATPGAILPKADARAMVGTLGAPGTDPELAQGLAELKVLVDRAAPSRWNPVGGVRRLVTDTEGPLKAKLADLQARAAAKGIGPQEFMAQVRAALSGDISDTYFTDSFGGNPAKKALGIP